MKTNRERILLIAVAVLLVSWAARTTLNRVLLAPLERQRQELATLNQAVQAKQTQVQAAMNAGAELSRWEGISLPSDEGLARTLYQRFIVRLVQECGFRNEEIIPQNPRRQRYFTPIPIRITGTLSLENLTEFLYRFYEPKLLHQVRGIEVLRSDDSNREVSVRIDVEGLALHTAPADRTELVSQPNKTGGLYVAGVSRDEIKVISRTNIFAPFRDPPPRPAAIAPPSPPQIDAKKYVKFAGCTSDSGPGYRAWLYDRLTNTVHFLQSGDEFDVAGVKGKLTNLDQSLMTFESDGERWQLRFGDFLSDMQRVPATNDTPAQTGENATDGESRSTELAVDRNERKKNNTEDAKDMPDLTDSPNPESGGTGGSGT